MGRDHCEGFSSGNPKTRCIFQDWFGCSESYYSCEDIKGSENSDICINNIPSDNMLSCYFDYEKNECRSKKRTCGDYSDLRLKSLGINLNCWELASETEGKTCVLSLYSSKCVEGYRRCEEYTDNSTYDWEFIIQSDGKGNFNYSAKCQFENNKCFTKERKCGEFIGVMIYIALVFIPQTKPKDAYIIEVIV